MHEPTTSAHPCSTPHSVPVGWQKAAPLGSPDCDGQQLAAAIELVLANPDAVAEVLTRARPNAVRHDGWTGERMAAFLETLADTGLITEACRAAGMSREAAYQLRNRDSVFAAAVAAAQSRARPQVADGLLERSITGTVEHYYRDGVLVGERRHYESWLGLAVLKRLDKQAEQERADKTLSSRIDRHWAEAMDALRGGGGTALLKTEVDELDIPPPPGVDSADRCWQNDDGVWMTAFPPPRGFAGRESGTFDGLNWYERTCTKEECKLLDDTRAAAEAQDLGNAHARRDEWFGDLRKELERSLPAAPAPDGATAPVSTAPPAVEPVVIEA